MLENFVYSLNATIPVFLVIVLGYLLGRAKMLNDNFVTVANRLTYSITLPVMLFLEISGMDAASLLDFRFLAFGFLSSLACILLIWGGARLFLKDKSMVGSFVQGSYRGSAALLGVALMQNIYGSASYASIMILAAAPLYNIMAVIILTIEGRRTPLRAAWQSRRCWACSKTRLSGAFCWACPLPSGICAFPGCSHPLCKA